MESRQVPEASNMMTQDDADHSPLVGELMDLYVAVIIVVPIAFLLKSFWV